MVWVAVEPRGDHPQDRLRELVEAVPLGLALPEHHVFDGGIRGSALIGLLAGMAGVAALASALRALLYGVAPLDPAVMAGVAVRRSPYIQPVDATGFHQLDRRWEHLQVRHPTRQARRLADARHYVSGCAPLRTSDLLSAARFLTIAAPRSFSFAVVARAP